MKNGAAFRRLFIVVAWLMIAVLLTTAALIFFTAVVPLAYGFVATGAAVASTAAVIKARQVPTDRVRPITHDRDFIYPRVPRVLAGAGVLSVITIALAFTTLSLVFLLVVLGVGAAAIAALELAFAGRLGRRMRGERAGRQTVEK